MQELDNIMQLLDAGKVEEKGEGGEMDDDNNQNVDDRDDNEIEVN